MSVEPTPRLGRAVRLFTPVVLTAVLVVPMLVTADASGSAGDPAHPSGPTGQPAAGPEGEGAEGNPGESSSTIVEADAGAAEAEAAEAEDVEAEEEPELPLYTIDSKTPPGALTATPPAPPCRSTRVVRLRLDRFVKVRTAHVTLDDKRLAVSRTKKGTFVRIDLRGRPEGVYTVRTVLLTRGGSLRTSTRQYATCGARIIKHA